VAVWARGAVAITVSGGSEFLALYVDEL